MFLGKRKFKIIVIVFLLIIAICLLRYLCVSHIASDSRITDFISYWASGHLLLNGENPYSAESIMHVQQSVGWTKDEPLVMYNPPWTLTFILPFCAGDYFVAKFMWLIILLVILFICNHMLWTYYNGCEENRVLSLIAFGSFAPVYFMVSKGQIVPLILVGLVGFLHYNQKNKWWLAALFTIFLTIKPQITYLFWISLLLWIFHHKNWAFLSALAGIHLVFMSLPLFFRFHTYIDYFSQMTSSSSAYLWATPVLGTYLRLIFGGENYWLQFIPMIISIIWLFYYYAKGRQEWDWSREMPIILFVSLISTFYGWVNDYVLLLVALTQATGWTISSKPAYRKKILVVYIIVNIVFFAQYLMSTGEHLLVWYVPALFAIYLFLMKHVKQTVTIMARLT